MRLIVVILVLVMVGCSRPALGAASHDQPTSDGKGLLKACSLTLDLKAYRPRKPKNEGEAFDLGYCIGLVQGAYAGGSGHYFCPTHTDLKTTMELIVKFAKDHPELREKDGADVVRWALTDEFPCSGNQRKEESDTQAKFNEGDD